MRLALPALLLALLLGCADDRTLELYCAEETADVTGFCGQLAEDQCLMDLPDDADNACRQCWLEGTEFVNESDPDGLPICTINVDRADCCSR